MATVITRNIDGVARQVVPFRKDALQPLQVTDNSVTVELVQPTATKGGANRRYAVASIYNITEAQQVAIMLNTHFARLARKTNQRLVRAGKGKKPMQLVRCGADVPPVTAGEAS